MKRLYFVRQVIVDGTSSPFLRLGRIVVVSLYLILLAFGGNSDLFGQTWSGLGGDSSWSNLDNWVGGQSPLSGINTDISFDHSMESQLLTNQDIANPFVARSFGVSGVANGGNHFRIGGSPISIAGNGCHLFAPASRIDFEVDVDFLDDTLVSGNQMKFAKNITIHKTVNNTAASMFLDSFSSKIVTLQQDAQLISSGQFLVSRGEIVGAGSMTLNNGHLSLAHADLHVPVNINGTGTFNSSVGERNTVVSSALVFDGTLMTIQLQQFNGFSVAFDGPVLFQNGTVNVTSSGNGLITGTGTIQVNANANVNTAAGVTIELDSVVSGSLSVNGNLVGNVQTLLGSTLSGSGLIRGQIDAAGDLAPGNSAGTLDVDGSVELVDTSNVCIEIGGTIAGTQHDLLRGSGATTSSATLAGNLDVQFIDNFIATNTDEFRIIEGVALSGRFANTPNDFLLTSQGQFNVEYGNDFVRLYNLTAVPEPGTGLFLALSLAGYLSCSRRRNRK